MNVLDSPSRGGRPGLSQSLTVLTVSVDTLRFLKHHEKKKKGSNGFARAQGLRDSRGGRPGLSQSLTVLTVSVDVTEAP